MKLKILLVLFVTAAAMSGEKDALYQELIGFAMLQNDSYRVLQRLCDEAGPRVSGWPGNQKSLEILQDELQAIGCPVEQEVFRMPGWFRGSDRVEMIAPFRRNFRVAALGYTQRHDPFEAGIVFAGSGLEQELDSTNCSGHIILVDSKRIKGRSMPLRSEVIRWAAKKGARSVLFINSKSGGLLMAGTSGFSGEPAPIPAYSISREEGLWLQRLLDTGMVRLKITTDSFCQTVQSANLVMRFDGAVEDKIVVGAHIDSWDLGQGAIDNGLGSAILFGLAQTIQKVKPPLYYTVELVWFNGEELGLFGAKEYARRHRSEPVQAMINLDMTGSPTGFNAMGFDEFMPFLEDLATRLKRFDLSRGVISRPWTNSDHMPFLMKGIPVFTPLAHLDDEQVKYYHSFGDTFDKVKTKYLVEATAVMSVWVAALAGDDQMKFRRRSSEEIKSLLQEHQLEDRLKRQGEWHFEYDD